MSIAGLKMKIMPESVDVDLESIKNKAKEKLESLNGKLSEFEEQPIAFGLKALIITAAYPEAAETDDLENSLSSIDGVSSVELIDYRRAVG